MTPEEEMVLFTVLQDIADELRKIKHQQRETEAVQVQTEAEDVYDQSKESKS